MGEGAAGRWSGFRARRELRDAAVVAAASGSVMLVSTLVAATQTMWLLGLVDDSGLDLPTMRRMVANLVEVAAVAGTLVALGLHRHRLGRQVLDVLAAGVVGAVLRVATQLVIGVRVHPPHDTWLLQLGTGVPMAWLAGGVAILALWAIRRVHAEADEALRNALDREAAMRALEDEEVRVRREVAEGLHGTAQQRLVLVVTGLDRMLATLDGTVDPATKAELLDLREKVETVRASDVRQASHLLYPHQLEVGLVPAVRALLGEIPASVSTALTVDPAVRELDEPGASSFSRGERLLVARVVEEALSNALHHGHASAVTVSIDLEDLSVVATVTDDGRGFAEAVPGGSGLGRLSERLTLVGGDLAVASTPGAGVVVRARVPIGALRHPAQA